MRSKDLKTAYRKCNHTEYHLGQSAGYVQPCVRKHAGRGELCIYARNLWASNSGRNPSIGWNGVFNFVNNVVFNWVHRSSDGGDYTAMFNMINNYYKPGPATPEGYSMWDIVS